jgi:hypothetical protein
MNAQKNIHYLGEAVKKKILCWIRFEFRAIVLSVGQHGVNNVTE